MLVLYSVILTGHFEISAISASKHCFCNYRVSDNYFWRVESGVILNRCFFFFLMNYNACRFFLFSILRSRIHLCINLDVNFAAVICL